MRRNLIVMLACAMMGACTGTVPDGGGDPNSTSGSPEEVGGGTSSGSGPHLESAGRVVVEAESFTDADGDLILSREWIEQRGAQAGPGPDPDGYHSGASGDAYLECLPDTRVTDADPLELGTFYDDAPGGASLDYEILFETPGTYFVWVRAYSTGTEDNGLHVGVNGNVGASGKRMQWCGTDQWRWSNAQRDSGGSACGVNGTITITIPSSGLHTVTFHQREDGFEFDRFLLTTDSGYVPAGAGPVESPRMF